MQIRQILKEAKQQLIEANVASYAIDAELILAFCLDVRREKIIAYPEKNLSDDEINSYKELIGQRAKRKPLSHILGKREFFGREFKVTSATLDPRPDSESLIEAVLELFHDKNKPLNIIDFGTGTGCLLLTAMAEYKNAKGTAVDIREDTLAIAKENSVKLGLANRCEFVVSFWGEEVKGKFDLILTNPPYIEKAEIEGLEPEVSCYEPVTALDGGDDGLDCYKDLAPYIADLLSADGFAVMEIGAKQEDDVKAIMENAGLVFVNYRKDLAGIIRCLIFKQK